MRAFFKLLFGTRQKPERSVLQWWADHVTVMKQETNAEFHVLNLLKRC